MRKTVITSILLLIILFSYSQKSIDVLHYTFQVELNDQSDTIYGRASITVKFLRPSSTVRFDLKIQRDAKGMRVDKITGPNTRGFLKDDDSLRIALTKPAVINDTATYVITYSGVPADGLIISKNKYGHRTFFADNWPNRGHNWIPCIDDPAEKAPVEFIVIAPQHYQVVANGIQIEETNLANNKKLTHYKEDVPISPKVMVIGVADFAVNLSGLADGCIPVYTWVYPEDRDKGFYDYAQATEILPFYIKKIGPYGYRKLANVQSKTIFGGLENANTIFYSETSVTGTRRSESLMAHEIAHQWFGNMATEKTFAHLWLSEGFATYMTILYMENKYGIDTARYMLLKDRHDVVEFVTTSNRTVVDNDNDYMALLNANSYQKGGWILHMLRRQLGDSIFWKSIRKYYATYGGKTADTEDLRKVFEEVSGKNLAIFFKQWLYTAGIPKLNISWKYTSDKKVNITVEQTQSSGVFEFPLELSLIDEQGNKKTEKLSVTKQSQAFTVSVKGKPSKIIADPNFSLLFSGKVEESK